MSTTDKAMDAVLLFLLGCALFGLGFAVGDGNRNSAIERDLVKKGHAEYYLDANNERQWRLKEIK